MTERRHPNVINRDEVKPYDTVQGKHQIHGRMLGDAAGGQQLGGTLFELPPGAVSFPLHYHCANEEAAYVISGSGTVRIGDQRISIRAGDWISHPVGPAHAHQMINDGTEPLIYLCLSTKHRCEVVGYPDSHKIGFIARDASGKQLLRQIVREGESLEYFEGEPDA